MTQAIVARRMAPDPLVEYFLDGASECGEIDACTAMTLRLYGNDREVIPILGEGASHFRVRQQKCLRLAEMADGILAGLPAQRRSGLVRSGLHHVAHASVELAETFSNWAIDDEIEGGDLLPFRYKLTRSRNGVPFKRTMRRLHSPKFIRRYVKSEAPEHASHLKALANLSIRRATIFGPAGHDPTISQDFRAQLNFRAHRQEGERRSETRADRKMILRSLRAATSVVGEETVRAFLHGDEIKLIGREAVLVLRKRGSLTDRGHGSLSVALADRNGTRLADLCTFIENTPTLDQLAGFALWMAAGEERAILETANVIQATAEGRLHPLLCQRAAPPQRDRQWAVAELTRMLGPAEADRIADIMLSDRKPFVRQLTHEQQRARNDAYWTETNGDWIEAMLVFVVGHRNFSIFKEWEAL